MTWEKDRSSFEIRTQGELADGRPALDEIVAHNAFVHLEQMSHHGWWMGIEAGGKHFHLWFTLEDGRLCVRLSDQDEENTTWEGDNRENPLPEANGPAGEPADHPRARQSRSRSDPTPGAARRIAELLLSTRSLSETA
jgi:hypothetical protein